MYHCGISVDMSYNVASDGGSSAYSSSAVSALKKYWGFEQEVHSLAKSDYWNIQLYEDSLKKELDARRPVLYSGSGDEGGHFFVIDGYNANSYFHINWGWGGFCDGYFKLDALAPGTGGIGSNGGSYNDNQMAIIGIKPKEIPSDAINADGLQLTANIYTDPSTIEYNSSFTIKASVKNASSEDFTGEVAFIIYDADFTTPFDTIGVQTTTITAGTTAEITYTFPGSPEYTGVHYVSLVSKKAGSTGYSKETSYRNRTQIEFQPNRKECGLVYECDFESELIGWTFAEAKGINSGFRVGTADKNQGGKSLYMSSDNGTTQGYEASTNGYISVAYKKLYLENGQYKISCNVKGDAAFMQGIQP